MSCNAVLMKMYGIKDPDIETERSIKKKALKYGMDTTNIVTANAKDFPVLMKGQAIPDGAVFNSKGEYIEYRATDTSCNAGLFEFIPGLNLMGSYNLTGKTTLEAELAKCRTFNGSAVPLPVADFYVLIYWTVWSGKLNKDHVKVWEDLAKNNKNCSVRVIKVNLDVQENWEEAERDKIAAGMGIRN